MKRAIYLLILVALPLAAQQPGPENDPIGRVLYPPELLMGHQQELALTDAQRTAIRGEIQKAQQKFLDFQFRAAAETERMLSLLQAKPIDEAKTLEQADKIMGIEREIKRTQLGLLIRIKNLLTSEQQAKADEIRKRK